MKNRLKYVILLLLTMIVSVFGGCGTSQETAHVADEKIVVEQKHNEPKRKIEIVEEKTEKSPGSVTEEASESKTVEPKAEKPMEKDESSEEPESSVNSDNVCTLSVNCKTALENKEKLKSEKRSIIPDDGIIYAEKKVEFSPGESAFDVLLREMRNAGIHMEFNETPMYKSVYIEGIGNLYEFDCGELSGWTYLVNGQMKNVGCSQYFVQVGDRLEFVYTCNMGRDVGGKI